MISRFDIFLIIFIILQADKLAGSRLPEPLTTIAVIVICLVLLILGLVRY